MQDQTSPTVTESAMRGLACRCPRCGRGKLYAGFLDLRANCEACGLDYAFIDAGDGPAIFIIMLAGAIVVTCALIVEVKYQPPYWLHAVLWLPLILRYHAVAAAIDEIASDRAAVPSQGRPRQADRSRAEMTGISVTPRRVVSFGVFTLAMVMLCVGLGAWQLQRRVEKHALVAALTERLAAAPGALSPSAQWSGLTPARDEFGRVSFMATYAPLPDAMVYSSGSSVREDISGPGTWAFMPARLPTGETVVVNAGFVQNTMQDRSQQDRAVKRLITGEPVTLTGYTRFPEAAGILTPPENVAKRLWFTRDHLAMARVLGWGEVAPFYIDLEAPAPASGVPKPGALEVHLKDDHMQYAITWFGLAGAMTIAFGVWLYGQRRPA